MAANEETVEEEVALVKSTVRTKCLDAIYEAARFIKHFIEYGNTLTISSDQAALAQPESYAKIRGRIKMNTAIGYEYLIMNTLATIIVCCGLATDSVIAIFGASTIALLLNPIMGASLAIVESDSVLFVQALFGEVVGALNVLIVAFVFSLLYRYHVTNVPESNLMQYATPNLLDLVLAIACGAACAYGTLSRNLRMGFSGVVLSITLLPPLAACSIFLAHGSLSLAAGSFVSFLTNFLGIQFTASVIFWLHGFKSDIEAVEVNVVRIFKKNTVSIAIIAILAVVLSVNLGHILSRQQFKRDVEVALMKGLDKIPGAELAELKITRNNAVRAVVRSSENLSKQQVHRLASLLPMRHHKHPDLRVRVVKVYEVAT